MDFFKISLLIRSNLNNIACDKMKTRQKRKLNVFL